VTYVLPIKMCLIIYKNKLQFDGLFTGNTELKIEKEDQRR